jgi:hypothetical protein
MIVRLRQWTTVRRFRRQLDRFGRRPVTGDGVRLPAAMDGHRLELVEACRAALEAFDTQHHLKEPL